MSLEFIKPLLESGIINEDTSKVINEVWVSKLNEAREQVRAELREEFSQRYEHDRDVMVTALDRMITESLQTEIKEFQAEKQSLNEDRVKAQRKLRENASKFNDFMVKKLSEEITELRKERKLQLESQKKLEQFVVQALSREIKDFAQDKQAVVEAKVKLVREGRKQLTALKQKFVAESAKRLSTVVSHHLKNEMTQLKEDIKVASENNFGRKLFEAFASEFSVTHLNEKVETRKLMNKLEQRESQLSESIKQINQSKKLIEEKERQIRIVKESNLREKTLSNLLSTLDSDRAQTMKNLLESVQTSQLSKAFDKYLPAVLNNGTKSSTQRTKMISEGVTEVTGDKSAKVEIDADEREVQDNVISLKRLAGL